MKKILLYSLFIFVCVAQAQDIRVGEWRDHLSYKSTFEVCTLGTSIYCSTDKALIVYDKSDHHVRRLNTLNGLSDTEVSTIASSANHIVIGYENGNIDLLNAYEVYNIPDIKRSSIIGNKGINHILVEGAYAYLSTGFGIVVLDLEKREIKDSYFIGENGSYINILTTAIAHDRLYAGTAHGLYWAPVDHPNLSNYEVWTKMDVHEQSRINLLCEFNQLLFTNLEGSTYNTDSLYTYNGMDWELFEHNKSNVSLTKTSQELTITRRYGASVYDLALEQIRHLSSSQFNLQKTDFRFGVFTEDKSYWIADKYNGLLHFNQGAWESIQPSGPYISEVAQIKNFDDEIWLAHGDKNENWDPIWNKSEVSVYRGNEWEGSSTLVSLDVADIVALNRMNGQTYLASWQGGVIHLDELDWVGLYNEDNSSLQKRAIHEDWTNIGAIEFDSEGQLWCTNSQTYEPVSVLRTTGEWESYSLSSSVTENQNIAKMIIDQNDQKWIQLRDNGMVVFDEKRPGTKTRKLTNSESGGNLSSDRVFSFIEDLDGEVWIGTDNGVCVIYDPGAIFDGENAHQVTITQDGHTNYLLKGQRINDIEIDGANRKWFATNNSGVIVTSENGTEQIHHFTTENSPLFSNKIIDIEFNDETGEVFIATDKGLLSYRTDASKGRNDFSDVLVFPNPVHPHYEGPITIKGLLADAVVKITDISGNLVYKGTALGGTLVWDGRSHEGDRVHSGVYLIYCSDTDGTITHVSKLLFIRG